MGGCCAKAGIGQCTLEVMGRKDNDGGPLQRSGTNIERIENYNYVDIYLLPIRIPMTSEFAAQKLGSGGGVDVYLTDDDHPLPVVRPNISHMDFWPACHTDALAACEGRFEPFR